MSGPVSILNPASSKLDEYCQQFYNTGRLIILVTFTAL